MGLLEHEQDVQRPPLSAAAEPLGHFAQGADPFAGVDGVTDTVQPAVRGTEVGVGAEDSKIKKPGTSVVGADAPGCDQGLNELPVDPAVWVVHNLLDFQLIFGYNCHGKHSFVLWDAYSANFTVREPPSNGSVRGISGIGFC